MRVNSSTSDFEAARAAAWVVSVMIVQNPWIGRSGPGPKQNRKPQGRASADDEVDAQGSAKTCDRPSLSHDINAALQHFKRARLRHSFAGLRSRNLCFCTVSLLNGLFTTFGEWCAHRNPVLILFCVHGISSEGMDASRETISRIAVREIKTVPPGDQKSRPMAGGELASTRR
jgi:hypothetical protein